ncbi:MAG: allose kinase [Lachnospiraceae bacterium]|nr:allose kinase [Lachnospiraceae bacterium]
MSKRAIGIDIGGTNFRIGSVDEKGAVEGFQKVSSHILCEGGEAVDCLADQIRMYLQKNDLEGKIAAIGLGFPSPVDAAKEVVYSCPNLQNDTGGFDGRNVVKMLEERLSIPTVVNKDANNLLQYELEIHGWKNQGTTIGIYYGTGIGNSVYLNDHFLSGKHGVACDLGHMPFYLSDRYCTCGNRGCVECYGSGRVLRDIKDEHYPQEEISDIFIKHSEDKVILEFLEAMAIPFASEVNIFDPDRVVIGGGVAEMEGFPFERLLEFVYEFARKPYPGRDFAVVRASREPGAGVAGSALYALEQLARRGL